MSKRQLLSLIKTQSKWSKGQERWSKNKNKNVVTIFQTCVIYFQYTEILSELKRLASVNLNGTYQREPHTRPPSCTMPQQSTLHVF